jgi:hypothetical protein
MGESNICNRKDCIVYQAKIHESNSISEMTETDKLLMVWEYLGDDLLADSSITVRGHENDDLSNRKINNLAAKYGWAGYRTGATDLSFADIVRRSVHPASAPR